MGKLTRGKSQRSAVVDSRDLTTEHPIICSTYHRLAYSLLLLAQFTYIRHVVPGNVDEPRPVVVVDVVVLQILQFQLSTVTDEVLIWRLAFR